MDHFDYHALAALDECGSSSYWNLTRVRHVSIIIPAVAIILLSARQAINQVYGKRYFVGVFIRYISRC